jgi:hypothetical protein
MKFRNLKIQHFFTQTNNFFVIKIAVPIPFEAWFITVLILVSVIILRNYIVSMN